MEFIIEFMIELLLEGSFELSKNLKTPKWLRYPLILLVLLFFVAVLAIIFIVGILVLKENTIIGILLIIIAILFTIYSIAKFIDIYIKRNQNNEESIIWNNFIEHICTKKIKELNYEQKNAVLCFYYDCEVNNGGHECYFDMYKKIPKDDIIEALEKVSTKKFASILKEAIKNGKKDEYEKVDEEFFSQSPCLTDYIEQYVINNEDKIFNKKEEMPKE